MIVNLRFIFALLLVIVGLTGCRRDEPEAPAPAQRPRVTLTLNLSSPEKISPTGTKTSSGDLEASTTEKKIYNLNIFLFPKNHPAAFVEEDKRHFYLPQDSLIPDLTDPTGTRYMPITLRDVCIGEYEVYIIANNSAGNLCGSAHPDDPAGCAIKRTDIGAVRTSPTINPARTGVIMSGTIESLKVYAAEAKTSLQLSFNMARVDLKYDYADNEEAKKIDIYSIMMYNAVRVACPFNATWQPKPSDYQSVTIKTFSPPYDKTEGGERTYITQNLAGTVPLPAGENAERYRNAANAPVNSTFVYFNCRYEGMFIGYSAYLGEDVKSGDVPTDLAFNVNKNSIYKVNVRFNSYDPTDPRQCFFSFKPNKQMLEFGTTGDFVYKGTNNKVIPTAVLAPNHMELQLPLSGPLEIETEFVIEIKNYPNNMFRLRITKAVAAEIQVYADGNPVAPTDNEYIVKRTGTTDGTGIINVKFICTHDSEVQGQQILFQLFNNSGQLLSTQTQAFDVKY